MIREARYEDFDRLGELYAQLYPVYPSFDPIEGRKVFEAILANAGLHLFLMEDNDGQLQASCYLNVIPNMARGASPYGLIENVITDEPLRGQGFGKQIIKHTLEFAWAHGCYKVMLLTGFDQVGNHNFYRACGFDGDKKAAFEIRSPG